MKRASLFLLFVSTLLPTIASAQAQTGTPPLGSFSGEPVDIVNNANLNVHINIPIMQKAGRGTPFSYILGYDSSTWYPSSSSGTTTWTPVNNWGWLAQTAVSTGYVTYFDQFGGQCVGQHGEREVGRGQLSHFIYYDAYGTAHPFPGAITYYTPPCYPAKGGSLNVTASDGSGFNLQVTSDTVGDISSSGLFSRNGTTLNPPFQEGTGVGSFVDRNGNEINVSANGVFTDTLGTTALTVAGSGTPSSPITFTYSSPSGGNAAYTEKFTNYTVETNFGCSSIAEFGPSTESLVSEIDLPDIGIASTDKYTITYEATPGHSGDVTGRIASITLPTGGTITYSYSGGSNGITCADGSTATLTRTTPDGTWTYVHAESGSAWTTTVTDPQNNQTVYDFQGIYQTERKVYQGATTLLEDDVTCYNGNTTSCNTTTITLPITERIVTKTLGTEVCKHVYFYNTFGLLTEQDDYDYGSGSPGSTPIRKTLISYASLGNNILDRPASITIQNGTGTTLAKTTYTYDQGTPTALSGTPQHVSISGSRGNPTTISSLVAGSTTLSKSFTYFDTGNIQTATDVNGAPTTYNYANATSTCGNTFPTSVSEPLNPSPSMTWNCTGGVETSVTDENTNTASTTYTDSHFWRPASSKDQEQNATNFVYASLTSVESSLNFNGSSSTLDVLATLDGLGRAHISQRKQSPSASNYDSVETDYDSLGRPSKVTVPYSGTAGQTGGSAPATTATYDALSRPLVTTDGGGGTVTLSYSANDILQTVGPAPTGENTKRRQSEYNSIGQLTSVCEVTSLTGSGTCAQNTSATGYWTKYAYDAAGRLLTVTQNAQSAQAQARSFTYDDLGRMTSEANPETGTINYAYDSDATCGTSNGDLVKKTDAAGNVICYAYDALHRATSITYPSGPNSSNTPSKHFIYDSATVNSVVMANAKTRLAEAYTCVSPCSTKITDEGFSYTVRGEVSDEYESTPHSSGYYHAAATYWANGVLNTLTGPGQYSNNYGVDGEGRVYSAGGGVNLASTTYNAASQPTIVIFGSLDSDSLTYDPNTGRMTQYKYNVNSQSVTGALTWNANGTLGSLNITDPFNAANAQNCSYTHDDLARVASGNCGSIWSQTFSYDAFGNITKSGSNQFQPTYSYATNQMSSIGSFTPTYDSNGDVLNDGLHSYAWDADTRPTTIDTTTTTYDALDRMVEQTKSGTSTEIEYSPTGFQMNLLNGQTATKAFVPMPGGTEEVWQASGASPYYRHSDWLGSSRFASTSTRTMYNDLAYAPFGEQYAQAGSTGVTDTSFAGNNEDTTTNLYDAQAREYGIQGRWPSPDPAGLRAVNPSDPQTWNRYAYVRNNPLLLTDVSGTRGCYTVEAVPGDTSQQTSGYGPYDVGDEAYAPLEGGGGGNCGGFDSPFGGGSGDDEIGTESTFGCTEFDSINPSSGCTQALNWFVNPNWSPWNIQYTGPASDGQTVTFDTWNQYANWRTTVASGAPDPCVYMNDSATGVQYVDYNSSPGECANSPGGGGNWVPPGFNYHVDSVSGTVVWQPQAAQSQGNSWSHPFALPTCHQLGVWAAGDAFIAAATTLGGKVWNPISGAFAISAALEGTGYAMYCQ